MNIQPNELIKQLCVVQNDRNSVNLYKKPQDTLLLPQNKTEIKKEARVPKKERAGGGGGRKGV
jgi:hypothetical protein